MIMSKITGHENSLVNLRLKLSEDNERHEMEHVSLNSNHVIVLALDHETVYDSYFKANLINNS